MYVSQTSYHKPKKKHGYLITDYWTTCSPVFNYFTGVKTEAQMVLFYSKFTFLPSISCLFDRITQIHILKLSIKIIFEIR